MRKIYAKSTIYTYIVYLRRFAATAADEPEGPSSGDEPEGSPPSRS
jgi:hypothetical protein